jgi:hypothetical protein
MTDTDAAHNCAELGQSQAAKSDEAFDSAGQHCKRNAREHGFNKFELVATLPGERFYRKFGYTAECPREYLLGGGVSIHFTPMKKIHK